MTGVLCSQERSTPAKANAFLIGSRLFPPEHLLLFHRNLGLGHPFMCPWGTEALDPHHAHSLPPNLGGPKRVRQQTCSQKGVAVIPLCHTAIQHLSCQVLGLHSILMVGLVSINHQ